MEKSAAEEARDLLSSSGIGLNPVERLTLALRGLGWAILALAEAAAKQPRGKK